MKRIFVAVLAMLFALPAITQAGSVTSKYDVNIGGYVKMDLGWQNQDLGPDVRAAVRGSLPGNQNQLDEYGSLYWYAGQTRLNMRVKGPDALGAKTSAFIEGDFRSAAGAGAFGLRHAYMKFDWAQSSLLIGQYWNDWGYIASASIVDDGLLKPMGRGTRQPQIRYTYDINKSWSFFAGIFSEYNTLAAGTATANPQTVPNCPTSWVRLPIKPMHAAR